MYDIAVIGAGASGLAAAIVAKRKKPYLSVALVEALPRAGKKILATGNGRCNLTNINATFRDYNEPQFVSAVMGKYPPEYIIDFFENIGLKTFNDSEGRVYPMSNMASSVLDCLRFEAENLDIELICDTHVDSIVKKGDTFIINGNIKAMKVILATGGKASSAQGSDGSGYPILKDFGHKVTPVYPALVQLTVRENLKALKGVRVKAEALLVSDGIEKARSSGEILFTDYGLSGIAVMDISRRLYNNKCQCVLDVLPMMHQCDVFAFLMERKASNKNLSTENVLGGLVPKKVGQYALKTCGIPCDKPAGRISNSEVNKICDTLKSLSFTVTGTRGFNNAQITVGGAELSEFDSTTLESKLVIGLYCTGELLNVDSICGGYNLQWAWASGIAAGSAAVK